MHRSVIALALALVAAAACDPQKADWGFEAVDSLPVPKDDPNLGCGVVLPPDVHAQDRAACAFGPGALASDSLSIDDATRAAIPIRHVVVMMKENRSFDHLLGKLHDILPDIEAVPPTYSNPNLDGTAVFPSHATTTCIPFDPGHQSQSVATCIDSGKMDGFVRNAAETTTSDGTFAISFFDATDLPYDYWLASTFAIDDRHFAPMASGTFANRDFMMFGTNAGIVDTGLAFPPPTTPSIFQSLLARGIDWGIYSDGLPLSGALDFTNTDPGVHPLQSLLDAFDAGTLPAVAFVDGIENVEDDHPLADVQLGEAWTKKIVDHALTSPEWNHLAIFWTYDEAGAFADHVVPPNACPAEPDSPFVENGPRVPFAAISPWAKRAYVSHVQHDHTAITRFIETIFALPALTARDANSDALFDLFDFSCGRDLSVPPSPAAGTGGCPNPPPLGAD